MVGTHVGFMVTSFETGLCCCLMLDSHHSVDIFLLFVHCKAVHFPRIKCAFRCLCQDVFGAYLQLLSDGCKGLSSGAEGGRLLCALSVFQRRREMAQRLSEQTQTHQYMHTPTGGFRSQLHSQSETSELPFIMRTYTQACTPGSLHRLLACAWLCQRPHRRKGGDRSSDQSRRS